MIRFALLLAATVIAATSSVAVQADEPTATERENAVKFWEYSRCVAERREWQIEHALRLPKNTPERRQAIRELADKSSRCLRSDMRVSSGPFLLNSITAAYVHRKYSERELPDVSAIPTAYTLSSLAADESTERTLQMAMHQFAECIVRSAPTDMIAFLGTEPFSAEENATIETLRPVMGQCLPVPNGAALSFDRTNLRLVLGKVAYELFAASENSEKTDA